MDREEKRAQVNFIIPWVITNLFGYILGHITISLLSLFSVGIGSILPSNIINQLNVAFGLIFINQFPFYFSLLLGITISQWIVLRHRLKHVGFWIPITILGYFVIKLIITGARWIGISNIPFSILLLGKLSLAGGVIGFFQWIILKKNLNNAIMWLFISFIAVSIWYIFETYVGQIGGILGWVLSCFITGYWLKYKIESSLL